MEWFDLINETLQAFLIVPLYSVLNKILKNQKDDFAKATFKTGLCTFLLYTLFSVGVLIYGSVLIGAMNPGEIDLTVTATYLRLETVAFMAGIIVSFANVVFAVIVRDISSNEAQMKAFVGRCNAEHLPVCLFRNKVDEFLAGNV